MLIMSVISFLETMLAFIDLDISTRVYTSIIHTTTLSMTSIEDMTITIPMPIGIYDNKGKLSILFQGYLYGYNFRYDHLKEVDDGYPFTYEVMAILVLAIFKPLANLEQYDGSTDP